MAATAAAKTDDSRTGSRHARREARGDRDRQRRNHHEATCRGAEPFRRSGQEHQQSVGPRYSSGRLKVRSRTKRKQPEP